MNSGNPVLRQSVFRDASSTASAPMTVEGTMMKTAMLLAVVTVAAVITFQKTMAGGSPMPWMLGGILGSLIVGAVIAFRPHLAPSLSVPHAALEGLFLGAVSAVYALAYPEAGQLVPGVESNIVFSAVLLTFAVSFAMFGLYAFRIIKVTQKLRSIVFAATGGIMLFYLINFGLSFFGMDVGFHRSGMFGIGFSLFVVGLASFNLLIDFDMIERGAKGGAPKWMEWFGAFALIVTLVWLYIEILRLLAVLARNDD